MLRPRLFMSPSYPLNQIVFTLVASAAALVFSSSTSAQSTFREVTGFDLLPPGADGTGVVFGLVEADLDPSAAVNNYRSNRAGISFTYQDAADLAVTYGLSSHANTVMERYALAATGSTNVVNTDAVSLYNRYLGINLAGYPPAVVAEPTSDVINLSFIFNSTDPAVIDLIELRTDYLVSEWNKVVVAGVSTNGAGAIAAPGSAYNTISVAELNNGYTAPNRLDLDTTGAPTAGRLKPDLLAPGSLTSVSGGTAPSFAAPVVSAAAAVLLQTARQTPALAVAEDARAIKSLLLTGATKLPGWDASADNQPLDFDQGAGVVNVARSYDVLFSGRAPASLSIAHSSSGWDVGTITRGAAPSGLAEAWYFLDVSPAEAVGGFQLTATLVWNRKVADTLTGAVLRDLNLDLASVTPSTFDASVTLRRSTSLVDNVEHIHATFGSGEAGRYAFRVYGAGFAALESESYALSWMLSTIPEPATAGVYVALVATALALGRRRRRV